MVNFFVILNDVVYFIYFNYLEKLDLINEFKINVGFVIKMVVNKLYIIDGYLKFVIEKIVKDFKIFI